MPREPNSGKSELPTKSDSDAGRNWKLVSAKGRKLGAIRGENPADDIPMGVHLATTCYAFAKFSTPSLCFLIHGNALDERCSAGCKLGAVAKCACSNAVDSIRILNRGSKMSKSRMFRGRKLGEQLS